MQTTQPIVGPPSAAAAVGQLLAGKYRVERIIGEGGMGVVYAAMNEALRQRVALKLLLPSALSNQEAIKRFVREARAAATLRSEHVARAIDVGALDDGRPYIVMEYLDGCDLGDLLEARGPFPVGEAVDYVLQACEAIAEAHAVGIIHRDLKPKNMFLTSRVDGRPLVKVLDFGISKVVESGSPGGDMRLTKTTQIIGSPSYMSPEQLRSSRNVELPSDIWSLGVILYELLTGKLPFDAQTVTELVAIVITERETPISALRADLPAPLASVVARCLEKKPQDRFQTIGELAQALEPFAVASQVTAAERVRAVHACRSGHPAKVSGAPHAPSSGVLPPPSSDVDMPPTDPRPVSHALPSSRPNLGRGGASVALLETQLENTTAPLAPSRGGGYPVAVAAALIFVAAGASGGMWFAMRSPAAVSPSLASPSPSASIPTARSDPPPRVTASAEGKELTTALPDDRRAAPRGSSVPVSPRSSKPSAGASAVPSTAPSSSGSARPPGQLDDIGRN